VTVDLVNGGERFVPYQFRGFGDDAAVPANMLAPSVAGAAFVLLGAYLLHTAAALTMHFDCSIHDLMNGMACICSAPNPDTCR
jgi:hypothetical protein